LYCNVFPVHGMCVPSLYLDGVRGSADSVVVLVLLWLDTTHSRQRFVALGGCRW
jgi:hypothetical protein